MLSFIKKELVVGGNVMKPAYLRNLRIFVSQQLSDLSQNLYLGRVGVS